MNKSIRSTVGSHLTLPRGILLLALSYIFLSEALIRANIMSALDLVDSTENPSLETPLLDVSSKKGGPLERMDWDEHISRKVPFMSEGSGSTSSSLYIVYDNVTRFLSLQNPSSQIVVDRIHVDDIIGAEIEFCLGTLQDSKECTKDSKYDKAAEGREKMESLEQKIGKQLLDGSKNEVRGDDSVGMGAALDAGPDLGVLGATAYLNIYAYPKSLPKRGIIGQVKSCLFSKDDEDGTDLKSEDSTEVIFGHREEHHRRFKLSPTEDFAQARQLIQNIRHVAGLKKNQRFLVVLNPFSGTKKAKQVYETTVKKMLQESGIEHDLLITEYAGHAKERMKDHTNAHADSKQSVWKDVSEYDGVVAMGGDGILSEIMKGIQTRSDVGAIFDNMNFGIVGCGTSNGLATSILHAKKVSYF